MLDACLASHGSPSEVDQILLLLYRQFNERFSSMFGGINSRRTVIILFYVEHGAH